MFVTQGSNTIEHVDADCHCACCNQLLKTDKIIILPSELPRKKINFVNNTAQINTNGIATTPSRSNVISLSTAVKSAEQQRAVRVEQANFKYPMLECS